MLVKLLLESSRVVPAVAGEFYCYRFCHANTYGATKYTMRDLINVFDSIVAEASVFKTKNSQYVPGRKLGISTSEQGAKTLELIKKIIPNFNNNEVLLIPDLNANPTYNVGAGPVSYKLQRPNGEIIQLNGSKSAIEYSLNDLGNSPSVVAAAGAPAASGKPKLPNKGDTAEGLLGAALFAKLLDRQNEKIGQITTDDVWNVFDNLNAVSGSDFMVNSKDLGGATDTIWFRLRVKNTVRTALETPELRKSITNWMLSPVNYVNSPEGTDYAEEFYKNGTPDEIGVISDGLSTQKDKKTDVVTAVRDPETNTIKREVMPISLKAGADQFAQHSGSKWAAMETMFSKLGIELPDMTDWASEYEGYQSKNQQIKAAGQVYKKAVDLLNSKFDSPESEAEFVQTVARALRFWATSDDDQVYVVSFGSRGKYDVLQFSQDSLVPAMKKLQLRARYIPGDNPKIEIYDKKSDRMLFSIRTYLQSQEKGMYQRNVIEKGPLLSVVADATGRNTDTPPNMDSSNDEPAKRLTGPGVRASKTNHEPRMDRATLGRERR